MKINHVKSRAVYFILFTVILIIEILIALFVRDRFIRPYGGDILITVLLCCFVRIFFPKKGRLLVLWVFLFAAAVEIGQYFDFVTLLGLGNIPFFRTWLGTSFSLIDLACYAVGCGTFWLCEYLFTKLIYCHSEKTLL